MCIRDSSNGGDTGESSSSLKKLVLTTEDLTSHTLQQLFDKGMAILPHEDWYEFSLKVSAAKSFSDDSSDNLELRNIIIRTKFNAIALVNTIFVPPLVSSKLFEIDPYAFNSLTDFISLTEPQIPEDLRLDALLALECISLKHVWCSDIMRNLGGNMSHGLMFQILRKLAKLLRDEKSQINEEYNVRFFYVISNIADVKMLHESLLAAGPVSYTHLDVYKRQSPRNILRLFASSCTRKNCQEYDISLYVEEIRGIITFG